MNLTTYIESSTTSFTFMNQTANWTSGDVTHHQHSGHVARRFSVQMLLWGLNKFLTPVIILTGLVGNVTSFLVFVRTHLRRLSSSVYLAALAVVDTGFLLQLFITWLNYVRVFLFHMDGWCQTVVYLSYVCSFLSVWYVVGFTVERYIAVCYPLKRQDMCTSMRAKKVVLLLALFACVAYSFGAWTSGVVDTGGMSGHKTCQPLPQYRYLVNIFNNIDTVITLIIPCVCIFVLNVRLARKIKYFYKKRLVMTATSSTLGPGGPAVPAPAAVAARPGKIARNAVNNNGDGGSVGAGSGVVMTTNVAEHAGTSATYPMRSRSQVSMTKMLLAVSTMFLVLNVPSHVIRVHGFFMGFVDNGYRPSYTILVLQQLFTIVYYCNFSVNFFLYSLCGKNFRTALARMYNCKQARFLVARSSAAPGATAVRIESSSNTMKSFVFTGKQPKMDQEESDVL